MSLHWGANPMEWDSERGFLLEGQEPPTQRTENIQLALEHTVEPEYLKTMRIPLLRGRFLSDEDNQNAARVVEMCIRDRNYVVPNEDKIVAAVKLVMAHDAVAA